MRWPPNRASRHAVALRAVGTEPPVPRKTTERSTTHTVSGHRLRIRFSGCELQRRRLTHQLAQRIGGPPIDQIVLGEPYAPFLVVEGRLEPQSTFVLRHLRHWNKEHGSHRSEIHPKYIRKTGVRPNPVTVIGGVRIKD